MSQEHSQTCSEKLVQNIFLCWVANQSAWERGRNRKIPESGPERVQKVFWTHGAKVSQECFCTMCAEGFSLPRFKRHFQGFPCFRPLSQALWFANFGWIFGVAFPWKHRGASGSCINQPETPFRLLFWALKVFYFYQQCANCKRQGSKSLPSGGFLGGGDFLRCACSLGTPNGTLIFNKITDFYKYPLVSPLVSLRCP